MCLAQGPQSSDAGDARTRGPSDSSQALTHCAPYVMLSLLCLIVLIPDLCTLSFFVVTCWERADLLALVGDVYRIFVTFPCGILGQVWYLIVSFPDLCHLFYFGDITKTI